MHVTKRSQTHWIVHKTFVILSTTCVYYKTLINTLDRSQSIIILSTTCVCYKTLINTLEHSRNICNTVHHLCMLQNVRKHTGSFTKHHNTVHHLCMLQNALDHSQNIVMLSSTCVCYRTHWILQKTLYYPTIPYFKLATASQWVARTVRMHYNPPRLVFFLWEEQEGVLTFQVCH